MKKKTNKLFIWFIIFMNYKGQYWVLQIQVYSIHDHGLAKKDMTATTTRVQQFHLGMGKELFKVGYY